MDTSLLVSRSAPETGMPEATHRYYALLRPLGPGTVPRNGLMAVENFDSRRYIDEIGREAWGVATYSRVLEEHEWKGSELLPEEGHVFGHFFFDGQYLFSTETSDFTLMILQQLTKKAKASGISWSERGQLVSGTTALVPQTPKAQPSEGKQPYRPLTPPIFREFLAGLKGREDQAS